MEHKLFIGKDCHDCQKVVEFIVKNDLEVDIINLDEDDATEPPIQIFVRPALFVNGDLKAYGTDIIAYLKQNN